MTVYYNTNSINTKWHTSGQKAIIPQRIRLPYLSRRPTQRKTPSSLYRTTSVVYIGYPRNPLEWAARCLAAWSGRCNLQISRSMASAALSLTIGRGWRRDRTHLVRRMVSWPLYLAKFNAWAKQSDAHRKIIARYSATLCIIISMAVYKWQVAPRTRFLDKRASHSCNVI